MKILEKKQPSFIKFREVFLNTAEELTGKKVDPFAQWQEIGDETLRGQILEKVTSDLEKEFGFLPVIPDNLVEFDGVVESVANQVHHNFSTMYFVEKINAKIRARQQQSYN